MNADRRSVLTAGTVLTTMLATGARAQEAPHEPHRLIRHAASDRRQQYSCRTSHQAFSRDVSRWRDRDAHARREATISLAEVDRRSHLLVDGHDVEHAVAIEI